MTLGYWFICVLLYAPGVPIAWWLQRRDPVAGRKNPFGWPIHLAKAIDEMFGDVSAHSLDR